CLVFPEGASEPEPVFLVPTRSAEEFAKSVVAAGHPAPLASEGGYAAVSPKLGPKSGTAAAPIALGLPAGDLVVRVDAAGLIARYRAEIDAGLGGMEKRMTAGGPAAPFGIDPTMLLSAYTDALRSLLDSAETLDLTLKLAGTRLELGEALKMKEKSPLAEFG